MAWSSSGHDGAGTLPEIAVGTLRMRQKYAEYVAFNRPIFVIQSASATVAPGGDTSLTVTVQPSLALTFQWLKDGNSIEGATAPPLTIASAQAVDGGRYSVMASTNTSMTAVSEVATVLVAVPQSGKLKDLSVLAHSGQGADVLTAGFVTSGGRDGAAADSRGGAATRRKPVGG